MVEETNQRLAQLGLTGEDIITIHIDEEFYHVFYTVRQNKTEQEG
jgi:hypothetical protein